MPYRRLPNTDLARIRAMKAALKKGNTILPTQLAFSQAVLVRLKPFLSVFERAVQEQRNAANLQANKNKIYTDAFKKAQMYVSHFIQVLNFTIMRGEFPANIRKFYGFDLDMHKVPPINTEEELIETGEKLIQGERNRTMQGGTPILNPKISLVSMHYEKFLELNENQKRLKANSARANLNVANLRAKADSLIVDIWNEVEKHYELFPPTERRKRCEGYGLVYVYRKSEKPPVNDFIQMSA
jgi:hypothetical protein